MPFQVTCGTCRTVFNVEEKHIGRTGKCAKCGATILITNQASQIANDDVEDGRQVESQPGSKDGQEAGVRKRTFKLRSASAKQKAFAADLGIKFDEDISAREISALIDAALAREDALACREIEIESHLKTLRECQPEEMLDQMEKRGFCALMLLWSQPDARDAPQDIPFKLIATENLTMEEVHYRLGLFMFGLLQREGLDFMQYCAKYAAPKMKAQT